MSTEIVIKIRAWVLFGFLLLTYPLVLVFALIYELFLLFGKANYKNIAGDVALVTGAGHGLGRCIAIELAKKGCHIAVADINMDGAQETAKFLIDNYKIQAKAYKVDVSKYDEVAALNAEITKDLGAATILINNAGVLLLTNSPQPDWQEVQRMINVNLTAHFWTNQIFLSNMKAKKRGHIVAISSVLAMIPLAYHSQYTSTKYAVRGMMRSLRLELKANRQENGDEIYATTVFPDCLKTNTEVVKIAEKAGFEAVYPLNTGENVARRIVTGILKNEEEIVFPSIMGLVYRIYETLPAAFQDFLQEYIVVTRIKKTQTKLI